MTYNLFMRPPPVHTNGCDYKDERLRLFCETQLDNFDVICF